MGIFRKGERPEGANKTLILRQIAPFAIVGILIVLFIGIYFMLSDLFIRRSQEADLEKAQNTIELRVMGRSEAKSQDPEEAHASAYLLAFQNASKTADRIASKLGTYEVTRLKEISEVSYREGEGQAESIAEAVFEARRKGI